MLYIILSIAIIGVITRVLYILKNVGKAKPKPKQSKPTKTMICIGSGGHTTEMLFIVSQLDPSYYKPRIYVIAESDKTSLKKVLDSETCDFEIQKIPRSRSVHQSYLTSIVTTLVACLSAVWIMAQYRPKLLICNGPGTCIPLCLMGFLMKCCFWEIRIIFVESICRVNSLSLTGKILKYLVDVFVVQSKDLTQKVPRAMYFGRLF